MSLDILTMKQQEQSCTLHATCLHYTLTFSPNSLSSEMLIPTYNTTQCNYPEGQTHTHTHTLQLKLQIYPI